MVEENKSKSNQSRELEKRIKDLETALGRKEIEVEFLNKILELADEEYKTDLKKNLSVNLPNKSEVKNKSNKK